MSFLINIYIFVCIMLFLFDVFFLLSKRLQLSRSRRRKNKTENMLIQELSQFQPKQKLSESLEYYVKYKTKNTRQLMMLKNAVQQVNRYLPEMQRTFFPYVAKHVSAYLKKSDEEQAFYAYAICRGEHEPVDPSFYQNFLRFLDNKSLFVFFNAMQAIYGFFDPYLLSVALGKVDERGDFYHEKLLVDGLLTFQGDLLVLHGLIKEKFSLYRASTQKGLLHYFRMSSLREDDFVLERMKKRDVDDEVYYEVLRYFIKYPNTTAKAVAAQVMQGNKKDWVEELLSMRILENYDGTWVKNLIKDKVISRNWHVRRNAVSYLRDHHLSQEEVYRILTLRDRYTNDALLYYFEDDPKMLSFIQNILRSWDMLPAMLEEGS